MVENRGPELQNTVIAFLVIAFVTTTTRCYIRARMIKSFGVDDWFMVAAMIFFIMSAVCSLEGVSNGVGKHFADLSPDEIEKSLLYWWLCYISYSFTMITAKLSIGFFLLRIVISRVQRRIIYGAACATVVVGVACMFVAVFQCTPVSYSWNKAIDGRCLSIEAIVAVIYIYSATCAATDLVFAIIPIFLVWKLQMDRRVKFIVVLVLGMGCVAIVAVLVRLAYIPGFYKPEFLYETVDAGVWFVVEQGLAIIAGSLACFRPIVQVVASKLGMSSINTPQAPVPDSDLPSGGPKASRARDPFSLTSISQEDREYGDWPGPPGSDAGEGRHPAEPSNSSSEKQVGSATPSVDAGQHPKDETIRETITEPRSPSCTDPT